MAGSQPLPESIRSEGMDDIWDWTTLNYALRRIRGQIDSQFSTIITILQTIGGGVLQGSGLPSVTYPTPPDVTKPWIYTNLDDGVIFIWSVVDQAWNV